MNKNFFALERSRRDQILNGAFRVFGENEYKKASMSEIAAAGGISKALLFHYFDNKKSLYLFLYDCACDVLRENLRLETCDCRDDFFALLKWTNVKKLEIMQIYPSLFRFLVRAYFDETSEGAQELKEKNMQLTGNSMEHILAAVNPAKFKEGLDIRTVLKIIIWTSEGFMKEQSTHALSTGEATAEFNQILDMLQDCFYK